MPNHSWRRSPGIRARTTLIAVLVVGVSAVLVMLGLVLATRNSLTGAIRLTAETRAQDIALLARRGSIPPILPGRSEDLLVQVLDSKGAVIASSRSIEGQKTALVPITLEPGVTRSFRVGSLADSGSDTLSGVTPADPDEPFEIAATGVETTGGPVTIIVGASLTPVQELVGVLAPRLAIGLPLLMVIVGLTVWALTGRALQPVEDIRRQAEAISATSLARRVPLPEAHDEIGMLAVTFNHMLDRLETSANAQKRFISDASHELKSPVASIHMMLDVARTTPSEDLTALFDDLSAEDARLERLLADLLTLAHFDERSVPANPVEVDLDDLAFREARTAARRPDVTVDVSGVAPVRLEADEGGVESIVRNLIENATRHAATAVWVAVRADAGEAVLTVSDDGPGIAEEDRERVFERFVRLDGSRNREDGGTGLGLAVCRALSRSAGGDVRVIEPLRGGATFELRLPLA